MPLAAPIEESTTDRSSAASPRQGGSLLSALQRKRDELAQRGTREERKLIPAWEGALSIVYRYPEAGADPIIAAVERAQAGGKPSDALNANCDVLIACWHTIEGRQPDGDWEPLEPGSERTGIFKAAKLLEIDVPEGIKSPARFILRSVFSPLAAASGSFEGDIPLMTQAGEIIRWLNSSDLAADEALRGE